MGIVSSSVGKNSSFTSESSLIWVGDTISGQCGNLVALFLWLYRINKVIYSNSFYLDSKKYPALGMNISCIYSKV
jgi:hypothetical protein